MYKGISVADIYSDIIRNESVTLVLANSYYLLYDVICFYTYPNNMYCKCEQPHISQLYYPLVRDKSSQVNEG